MDKNNNLIGNYQQKNAKMNGSKSNNNNNCLNSDHFLRIYMSEKENSTFINQIGLMPNQQLSHMMIPTFQLPIAYPLTTNVMQPLSFPSTNNNNNINNNNNKTSLIQLNGRKVLGPPDNWVGPPPGGKCELYVRRVPKDLNEQNLVQPFLRFGPLYEIRLPLDYQQSNRGYAYIKYTNEEDANAALEVMQHYFISPGVKFEIEQSYEKCRLFISNIPANLNEHEIEHKLRQTFPTLQRIYFQDHIGNSISSASSNSGESDEYGVHNNYGNHGNVIVQFASHNQALEAKKNTNPGVIRLWGRDLRVMWANAERDADLSNSVENKTLFFRNIDLTINPRDIIEFLTKHVARSQILKVSRVRHASFVDFATRETGEFVLQKLQGALMKNRRLEIEWAKPCDQ